MSEPRSGLHRRLLAGGFAVTAELPTTDGADPSEVARLAAAYRGRVDAVNCTDNSAAHPHLSAIAAAALLVANGVEPIMQLGCRDRNRLALQADLLGAAALGVRNIVCMTGDDVTAGDHPEAKPIFDIDGVHLLRIARTLRDEGVYLSGRALTSPPSYFVGAVENPFAPPFDFRPVRLGTKADAGAEFVQTQCCFNLPRLRGFLDRSRDLGVLDRVHVLVGVFVPRSARALRYLRDEVPGMDVPDAVMERLEGTAGDRQRAEGVAMAVETIRELLAMPGVSGVHLMGIRNEDAIFEVLETSGLDPRPALP
ncbi:MAG: methylenetetrahydrofolate reductase [Actinomycetota bacterium]